MRKLLNKPWFVALLGIAALAAVWSSLAPAKSSARPAAVAPAEPEVLTPSTETVGGVGSRLNIVDALKQLPSTKSPRDPFAARQAEPTTKPDEQAVTEPDFVDTARLAAVWTQNGETLAIVNNRIYRAGDSIGRFKIESAGPGGVWLSHWKGRTLLETGKTFILKTPPRLPGNISSP